MNKYALVILSLSGGAIAGLAWSDWCSGLILLIGLVPFMIIENHIYRNPGRYTANSCFLFLLPGFIVFALATIGWIRVISIFAAVCIVLFVSSMMSLVFWAAHLIRVRAGTAAGILSFIAFWLTMEFLCVKIDLLSPWLNLGNGLSKDILYIQWYEMTGISGGTLWILISNILFTRSIIGISGKEGKLSFHLLSWILVITIPAMISIVRYNSVKGSTDREAEVLLVQPNYDPYHEKYTVPFDAQLDRALELARSGMTGRTKWVLTPETIIDDPVNESEINHNNYIQTIRRFNEKYPGTAIVTGMVTWQPDPVLMNKPASGNSIRKKGSELSLRFNSAVKTDTSLNTEVYHKSKLVPGFENAATSRFFSFARKLLPDLGGSVWGYGVQEERECFSGIGESFSVAPVICYESVFGEYVTGYIKKGAEVIFILTNDGWWKNTKGYRQHLHYASLRAIETRRPVVRAANTGISCFIDIKGRITSSTKWWEKDILRGMVSPRTEITQYVKSGDVIYKLSALLSVLLILPFLLPGALKQ